MPARRLPAPLLDGETRGPLVRFTFDGREYEGFEGEPLAASLLAAGRPILSRSFRFHRPRGLMCSTGQCGWCECEVDGRPSVRSCGVPVRAGLVARGEHALGSVDRDLLSLVGLASRWIPPTFYHHRFLRPRALRKRYLDVLRWFGGRGRLRLRSGKGETLHEAPRGRPTHAIETDVLVVGGGRSGLVAALEAVEAGARVVLIEADAALGGPAELQTRVRDAGVAILTGVVAVGWYDGMVAAIGDEASHEIRAAAVVAATGSYDRVPLVPGNDRPGVMAARTVVQLLDRQGILPGERALLVGDRAGDGEGDGDELAAAGARLARAGATVLGPVPTTSLQRVLGRRHVTAAVIRDGARERRERVDLVVFGDRSPSLDLILAAGVAVERIDNVLQPVCDGAGRTNVASLFVVGSAAGRPTSRALDDDRARLAGNAAAGHAAGRTLAPGPAGARRVGEPAGVGSATSGSPASGSSGSVATVAGDALVCFCEDVRAWEIRAEQAAGYVDPELIKRRTGALTGPCQGKYCLGAFACLAAPAADGPVALPTARPPLRPVRLGDLVASDTDARDQAG